MNPIDIEAVIGTAVSAVDLILGMQRRGQLNPKTKANITDLVTEADVASEALIRLMLRQLDPTIGFWGEESNTMPSEERFWIVDPIDGTVNFAHGISYGAVTIALYSGEEVELGVTAQFPYRRVFWGKRGAGAFVREPDGSQQRLRVNEAATLQQAFLATGFPYHSGEHSDNNLVEFNAIALRALGLRIFGSAAMDAVCVATGALAGFWEGWLHPWDAAAGSLMVLEAGGRVTGYDGRSWSLRSPGYICSNGKIHDELLEAIQSARKLLTHKKLAV
jgi:myo-inositol-1(or 4)-monophosphatase